MNTVQKNHESEVGILASFGSGNRAGGGGRSGARAASNPRGKAPAGAVQSLYNRTADMAGGGGRGSAARKRLAAEVQAAAISRGGGVKMTNAQLHSFRQRLAALSG